MGIREKKFEAKLGKAVEETVARIKRNLMSGVY